MQHQKQGFVLHPVPPGRCILAGCVLPYTTTSSKQRGGDFILRIEDTDSTRFVPGSEEYIQETFDWLGMPFDESPAGERLRHTSSRNVVRSTRSTYIGCWKKEQPTSRSTPPGTGHEEKRGSQLPIRRIHPRTDAQLAHVRKEETKRLIDLKTQYVVRVKIEPKKEIVVDDMIRGKVVVNSSVLDDKVIYKSADELPTYHLANVVDDHLMKITHVIRGEEWLPSAPLHVWLYQNLGWEKTMPRFAHLPLLLKPEGNGKLSKRDGDRLGFPVFPLEWKDPASGQLSMGYREAGYLPEAVINFLALLGWNPGTEQELFTLDELIQAFSFERCSKGGAKFDIDKAKWYNHQYIMKMPNLVIAEQFHPILEEKGISVSIEKVARIVGLIKDRVHFLKELWEQSHFFFEAPTSYDEKTVRRRWKEETP